MNKVVQYIRDYRQSNPTGWRKWIIGAVVAVLSIVVIALFAFQAAQHGRSVAALKHAQDAAKQAAKKAQVDAKLATTQAEAARHEAAAEAAVERAEELQKEIEVVISEHKTNEELINSIRSWEDVDRIVK